MKKLNEMTDKEFKRYGKLLKLWNYLQTMITEEQAKLILRKVGVCVENLTVGALECLNNHIVEHPETLLDLILIVTPLVTTYKQLTNPSVACLFVGTGVEVTALYFRLTCKRPARN